MWLITFLTTPKNEKRKTKNSSLPTPSTSACCYVAPLLTSQHRKYFQRHHLTAIPLLFVDKRKDRIFSYGFISSSGSSLGRVPSPQPSSHFALSRRQPRYDSITTTNEDGVYSESRYSRARSGVGGFGSRD